MRSALVSIVSAGLMLASCGGGDDANAGAVAGTPAAGGSRSYPAAGFDRIAASGPDDVVVHVGSAHSVKASGPADAIEKIVIRVVDGELRIEREKGSWFGGDDKAARVDVTLPRMIGASLAGSGDMTIDKADASDFKLALAGSGNVAIATLTASGTADISVAGSGNVTLAGTARMADISTAGSGDIDAHALFVRTADISSVGAGDVRLAASDTASISVMGSGDVTITGTPQCDVNKLGTGEIKCGN